MFVVVCMLPVRDTNERGQINVYDINMVAAQQRTHFIELLDL